MGKLYEDKKEDSKEDKNVDEEKKESKKKTSDDKSEIVELEEKTEEEPDEQDLVLAIQHFVKYITWEYTDAEYYLKEVKGKLALSMEDQNVAMTQMEHPEGKLYEDKKEDSKEDKNVD